MGIRKGRRVVPERWEANKVKTMVAPIYSIEGFQATVQGRGTQAVNRRFSELKRQS